MFIAKNANTLTATVLLVASTTIATAQVRPEPRPAAVMEFHQETGDFSFIICRSTGDDEREVLTGDGQESPVCNEGSRIVAVFDGQLENGNLYTIRDGEEYRADASLLEGEFRQLLYSGGTAAVGEEDHRENVHFNDTRWGPSVAFRGGVVLPLTER